jgi:hypothetical protein
LVSDGQEGGELLVDPEADLPDPSIKRDPAQIQSP